MKIYRLHTKQNLPITLDEAWELLSDPKNLQKITPEYMGFKILSGADRPMFPGQIIQYKVSPLLGLKLRWMTVITYVKENSYFVDEQRFGPYALWHHKHFFEATEKGTKMTDLVHYALPLGFLGRIMNTLVVKNKLKEIFDYRFVKVDQMFNSK